MNFMACISLTFAQISSKFTEHGNLCLTMDLHIKEVLDSNFSFMKGIKDMPFSGITLPETNFQIEVNEEL